MDNYAFFDSYYNTSGISENDVLIFAKNGNTLRVNIYDLINDLDDSESFGNFKNNLDVAVHDYFYSGHSGGSLIVGYFYSKYDDYYYLVIDRQEVTHFSIGNTNSFHIDGYRMQYNDYYESGYLGLYNGATSNLIGNAQSGYVLSDAQIQYTDFSHTINAMDGVLFDYTLCNDARFTLVGGADSYYNSFFQLSTSGIYYFRFGEKVDEYQNGYSAGYLNGFSSGEGNGYTHGRSDGYQAGYYDGLAEGGNAPQSVFGIVGGAINSFTPVLNIEILPHITLGTCISIPIICIILVAIFKIARG